MAKLPEKYVWTKHAEIKMRYYRLSKSRIQRIIRFPERTEQGILEGAVAVMAPAGTKQYSEIWAMYLVTEVSGTKQIRIITAWRYPGESPERDPVPAKILKEARSVIQRI